MVSRRLDWDGAILYAFMTIGAVIMVLPFVYMVSNAFKPMEELFLFPPRFWVIHPTVENFIDLFKITSSNTVPFTRYIFNSLVVSAGAVVGSILVGSMAAYPLSKHPFPGSRFIFMLIIYSLMFSTAVMSIPVYLIVTGVGWWIDTYWVLIIPQLASTVGVFLMKQFLDQIPNALLEAARIDGAGEWRIFLSIVIPHLKPAILTLVLVVFVGAWNDPTGSAMYITSDEMKTLPFVLSTLSGGQGSIARTGVENAVGLLMFLPGIIVFIFTQRQTLQTMAYSGLKE
jgi:ABC-type glycerol-3-phosphate transport system permease component